MKYKLFRKDFEIWKDDISLLPNIRLYLNDPYIIVKNWSIEFHFLVFHSRLLFIKEMPYDR